VNDEVERRKGSLGECFVGHRNIIYNLPRKSHVPLTNGRMEGPSLPRKFVLAISEYFETCNKTLSDSLPSFKFFVQSSTLT